MCWGLYRDSGKQIGNYCLGFRVEGLGFRVYWGLYRDSGKENGNYCLGFRVQGGLGCLGSIGLRV